MPVSTPTTKDNSQSLIDIANNTFRELCRTLEHEQERLLDLEERRKKLYDEMQRLRAEIEEEKHIYKLNIMESVSENLCNLNKSLETACTSTMTDASADGEPTESIEEFIVRQRSKLERINKSMDDCLANSDAQIEIEEIKQENDASDNHTENDIMAITNRNEDNLAENQEDIDNDVDKYATKNLQDELKIAMTASIIEKCLTISDSEPAIDNDDCKDNEKGNDCNGDTDENEKNIDIKA